MVNLYFGIISVMKTASGLADIIIPDRNNAIISDIPFVERVTTFPKVGEQVAVLLDEDGTKVTRSVILGRIYANGSTPSSIGAGAFTLSGSNVTINGSTKAKAITASSVKAGDIDLETHKHHYTWKAEEGEDETEPPT